MKKHLALVVVLAVTPFAAFAADGRLDYTYLEGGYLGSRYDLTTGTLEPDGSFSQTTERKTADGGSVRGAAAIAPNFHLFGEYSTQDYSFLDSEHWRLGVGYNHQIGSKVDLLARIAYDRSKVVEAFDGWSVEAGVRAALTARFEVHGLAGYQDYEGGIEGDFYGRIGAQFRLDRLWGISGEVIFGNGQEQYFIGPRISF